MALNCNPPSFYGVCPYCGNHGTKESICGATRYDDEIGEYVWHLTEPRRDD